MSIYVCLMKDMGIFLKIGVIMNKAAESIHSFVCMYTSFHLLS